MLSPKPDAMVSLKLDDKIWQEIVECFSYPSYTFIKRFQVKPDLQQRCQSISSSMTIQRVSQRYQETNDRSQNLHPLFNDQCPHCYEFDIRIIGKEGSLVCIRCGYILAYNNFENSSSISEPGSFRWLRAKKSKPKRMYEDDYKKRRNHFKFWLQRFQGKERHRIPLEDIQLLQAKLRSSPVQQWDYLSMKKFLKKNGFQKHYHHVYYLLNVLCDMPLVKLTSYHEEQLMDLFQTIQQPFKEHRGNRINMLGYTYLLIKFIEILGWGGLHEIIPRLTCHRKVFEQDRIWKLICDDLDLPFIRTTL